MIPLYLSLSGFLSYCDPVELDFTPFELACIAGPNGAGKSSLLDAITWALFGQARKRDDALINTHSTAASVCLVFLYEENIYRVQRIKPREKTAMLEFHILQDGGRSAQPAGRTSCDGWKTGPWKPLTERTLRETEDRIQQVLRLDYDTFVNASFFLQGKADQFTQHRPGDRKRILSSILGLEMWEAYRERASARRKELEVQISNLEGRLQEINAELAEERARKVRLEELRGALSHVSQARAAQEAALENIRRIAATLAEQQKMVDSLARQLETAERRLEELGSRLEARRAERDAHAGVLAQAAEIEAAEAAWKQARAGLERWEGIAARFREHEKRRQGPLDEINAARAALLQELQMLEGKNREIAALRSRLPELEARLAEAEQAIRLVEGKLEQRARLAAEMQEALERQAGARAENPRLKEEMDQLKERIEGLERAEGAACPLCGQPLTQADRRVLVDSLRLRGKELGDRYRANKALLEEMEARLRELEGQGRELERAEEERRERTQLAAQLSSQVEVMRSQCQEWEANQAPRLAEIAASLQAETFAPQARACLAQIDAELRAIGYDAAAHDAVRRAEAEGRAVEGQMRALEAARAAIQPLEREIGELQAQLQVSLGEVQRQREEHRASAANLEAARSQAPDLEAAEGELFTLVEQENRLLLEVGAAQQKIQVLDDLRARRRAIEAERQELARRVAQHRQLERAFGKDGVPALLIEQALPQIEAKANEILDRLSMGAMSVRFITQAAYKDRRRDDLKETLDILISDSAGTRDYEMFSGGEAFRVNFAIRLALSEVLSQRAGARLQTLIIDEGFGSQDNLGRQRLIEAIHRVRQDFAKILVITHVDELKDAFPVRIEVEKTERGSALRLS